MKNTSASLRCTALLGILALSGCVTPGAGGLVSTGTSPTAVTGGAAGGSSVGANSSLERCTESLGTLAVDDGRGKAWYASFGAATKITSIEPLLRVAVQQSNCFVITSIGNSRTDSVISAITQQQRNSGEFRAGSNQQKGQRVAADYYMEPSIVVDNSSTGKLAGALGGFLGSGVSRMAGALETKSSVVTLSMFDIRSSVQIAVSEGNSTATNYGAALGAFGGGAAGSLSGFSSTPEGKATVAAFIDAYNSMVVSLRNYKAQEVRGGLGRGGVLKVGQ